MAGGAVTVARRNLLLLAVVFVALTTPLASCVAPVQIPKEVKVPVAVPCVPEDRKPPAPLEAMRPEAEIRSLEDYKVIPRLRADRLELIVYARAAAAIVEGCSKIPAAPAAAPGPR
jgi:hypothetical protein